MEFIDKGFAQNGDGGGGHAKYSMQQEMFSEQSPT